MCVVLGRTIAPVYKRRGAFDNLTLQAVVEYERDVAMLVAADVEPALWRTKKSHFRPSDEKSMKNVDRDVVNTKIGLICYLDA